MRAHLLAFVTRLRAAGLRVSVAETIDAMAAIEAAGIAREVMREALAATLVKEESDRAAFDAAFDEHFPLPPPAAGSEGKGRQRGSRSGGEGAGASGRGAGDGSGGGASRLTERDAQPPRGPRPGTQPAVAAHAETRAAPGSRERRSDASAERARAERPGSSAERTRAERPHGERAVLQRSTALGAERPPGHDRPGRDAAGMAAPLVRRPFADLDPDQLDSAREAARQIGRRFLARVSRRFRRTRRGHVDVRRTIRRAVARGGALIDLQRRGRRPGKPDLVVLCDVSGSVARASDLLLSMLAAAEGAFARVTRFAFVDRLVGVEFVDGQIRPDAELDLYARSDLGKVLSELEQRQGLIDRRTVLLVLGDARNNRLAARADVLRRLARRARAVVWAVPEPRVRWDTGDSALASYAASCDLVVEATSLAGLVSALREAAR